MTLSAKIREQIISSFRAELVEHIQTMTNGLLAIEQERVAGDQRQTMLEDTFRAAHSLKGAARAVGVTIIEQLAHSLESVLDALQCGSLQSTRLFSACYETLDAIQAVQAAYEAGETTPPARAMQALTSLEQFCPHQAPEKGLPPPSGPDVQPAAEGPKPAQAKAGKKPQFWTRMGSLDALMGQLDEMISGLPGAGDPAPVWLEPVALTAQEEVELELKNRACWRRCSKRLRAMQRRIPRMAMKPFG
jgi:two-component system chemotaxis sensor kinase CheA